MKLKITVEEKTYEVEVELDDATPTGPAPAIAPMPGVASVPSMPQVTNGGDPNERVCRSPIVGVVVKVNVQPGQQVKPEDQVIVLEAMKMETNITAPFEGKVKEIKVKPGDAVQPNQILLEFE